MKAIVVEDLMTVKVKDVPEPRIESGRQVIVRVKASGICGSDMHTLKGTGVVKYPRIPGHEFVGVVEETGGEVTRVKVGDRVAVEPITYCGKCYACRKGRQNVCTHLETAGVHFDGGMQELFLTTEDKLYRLPDDITFHQAVLAEPYTIGLQIHDRAGTRAGDVVLIHGAGPIGMIALDVAKQRRATVIVSEMKKSRREMAEACGADYIVNPSDTSVRELAMELTHGIGPDVVIDAAGIPSLIAEGIDIVAPGGAVVNLCFTFKTVEFNMLNVIAKEVRVVGSRLQNDKFPEVVGKYAERLKDLEKIITHTFPAERGKEAYDLFAKNLDTTGKIVVEF